MISDSRYEVLDLLWWIHGLLAQWLGLPLKDEEAGLVFDAVALSHPITELELSRFFLSPIYRVAGLWAGRAEGRTDNPITEFFLGRDGIFRKNKPMTIGSFLAEVEARLADPESDINQRGNIILRYTYEGPALSITFVPLGSRLLRDYEVKPPDYNEEK